MERVRELVWPVTAVAKRDGSTLLVYDDNSTSRRLVRGGICWPRIVGPIQRPGWLVAVAMELVEDRDRGRIEAFVHGPFASVMPVIDGGRVVRPGLSELVGQASFRVGAAEFWCNAADDAARYWRREVRDCRGLDVRLRQALNFGPDAAAHLLWQIEASGRLLIPQDLGAAVAEHEVIESNRGALPDNPPRFALALAIQAVTHARDREEFFSAAW